jgi:hypothetical protein
VVGFGENRAVYWAPFTTSDERSTLHVCESVDPLRFLDEAVAGDAAEERLVRCCSLSVRRICQAVWCAILGDLFDPEVCKHLLVVADKSADPVPIRALRGLCASKSRGLWFAITTLTRGMPTQISKTSHDRSFLHSGPAVHTVLEPRLGLAARSASFGIGTDDFKTQLSVPETSVAHVSASLHLFNVNELLAFWLNNLKHHEYRKSDTHWTQTADAFLALVQMCLTSDFDYSASAAAFVHETMTEDYKEFRPPILALWHGLLTVCASSCELSSSIRALYDLQRVSMKDWFKNRVRSKFNADVQLLILTGIMAHAMEAWDPEFEEDGTSAPKLPFLRSASNYRLPCMTPFVQGVDRAILASATDMSYRAAVTEVQLCIPSLLASRGLCCYSNRVVHVL